MKKQILRQIIMLSKWTVYGLIFNVFTLGTLWANELNAQEIKSVKETVIQVNTNSFGIEDLFMEIEHKTNYNFSYNKSDIDPDIKIRISDPKASVADILMEISRNSDLKFKQVNNSIHVSTKKIKRKNREEDIQIFIQEMSVSGKVTSSEDGQGLPGVNVILKGTTTGTVTDAIGEYTINIPSPDATLVFSSVGFLTQEIQVNGRSVINLELTGDIQALSEIVVIGYGTQKKADITGAIAQMDAENLDERPVTRLDQALVGQMAGVRIKQTSGVPGKGFSIQIRGTGTITANTQPLYVVDGFPLEVSDQNSSGGFTTGNPLDNINPNDIESIQVLKDASSTSIYGARGANGVVIINTKRGRTGKPVITFNAYGGWTERSRKLDMLTAEEWVDRAVEFINTNWVNSGPGRTADQTTAERLALNGGTFSNSLMIDERWLQPGHPGLTYYDMQDEIFQRGPLQNYQLSASGGTENVNYYVSGNYLKQDGFIKGVKYDRYTARANIDVKASDRVTFGLNLAPSYSVANDPGLESKDDQMHLAASVPPISEDSVGLYFNTGEFPRYAWGSSRNSPVIVAENTTGETKIFRTIGTIYADIKIIEGLNFKTTFNLDNTDSKYKFYRPAWVSGSGPGARQASGAYRGYNRMTYVNENILSFKKIVKDNHSISAVAGISYTSNTFSRNEIVGSGGFTTDFITTLNDAVTINTASNRTFTNENKNTLLSYFGRFNYDYKGKYLFQAVVRRDGSSRFGDDTKWGVFPAFSAGWRLSEEAFMQSAGFLSDLKLRASWGITGNESLGSNNNYEHIALLDPESYVFGGQLAPGQVPANFPNRDLSWEDSETLDIGFDFGIFDNRINGSFDYYTKTNSNLLLNIPVPTSTGFENAWTNIGEVLNKGWEFELNSRNLTGDLGWSTNFNFSHNTNEVVQLGPDNAPILGGDFDIQHNILMVGEPMYSLYVVHQDGILTQADIDGGAALYGNQSEGDPKYVDFNGDGVISPDDRQLSGHPNPDYVWGITNTFTFKGFDLNFLFQGQWGGKIYSTFGRAVDRTGMGFIDNAIGAWRDRWRSPEDPGAGLKGKVNSSFGRIKNTDWLYPSDYWRLRNITLGYNLGTLIKNKVISNARIYITAENYFGKDKYTGGFNPEAVNTGGDDYGAAPLPKSMIFGLNLSF